MGIFNRIRRDIGIDLGTANTCVYIAGQGVVLSEPSVVAFDRDSKKLLAVGEEARQMLGRTPGNITASRPLRDGVIADFDATELMLQHFIRKVVGKSLLAPRMVIGIPSGVTGVERRAVMEAAVQAGAKEVFLVEEPIAAAIGAGLPISEPVGSMIVDIGGGTTEVAIISLQGSVISESVRVAGDEMNEAIATYLKKLHNLVIGERTAEMIKIQIGSAFPYKGDDEQKLEVRGLHMLSGLPRTISIHATEVRESMSEPLSAIVEAVKRTLEQAPPELAADIYDRGIVLAGGGALLKGLDGLISHETGIAVHVAEEPLNCVVLGTGKILETNTLNRVFSGTFSGS
ncbi:MAG: rod shape-determining protein [Aphanocapsa lilacina HA4352-LM1]|jgi:rod shape-determining protein MreB|uniref:Cell shape-determining protein MreB n=1 Tax=Gloeobacter morelensis MG652769 TaxID=2781736 RepID=A0ABY3PKX6_9CYAN|nr:rod shape-determining protein [Gloeobacter morelensis]MBW4698529.1 rod shape-determining protein [Aphanocapsa lilacina HA4352-LM1]UFP94320.1 rod shape-determining protein [Gloeobacter morelensis MG652769]